MNRQQVWRLLGAFAAAVIACAAANAEEFDNETPPPLPEWGLEDDLGLVFEADGDEPTEAGPGFRRFARLTLGGLYPARESSLPAGFQADSRGALGMDFTDIRVFTPDLSSDHLREITGYGSVSVRAQHLWLNEIGLQNDRPEWRVRIGAYGVATEFGKLPLADVAFDSQLTRPTPHGWFEGFKSAGYVAYGVEFKRGLNRFELDATSDLVGRVYSSTDAVHTIVGPEIVIGRVASRGRWAFDLSASLLMGYGRADFEQTNSLGVGAIPGGLNRSLVAQPIRSSYRDHAEHFATHTEVRFVSSYFLRRNWSLDATARLFVTGPVYEASRLANFSLPDLGLNTQEGSEYVAGSDLFFGVTYLH